MDPEVLFTVYPVRAASILFKLLTISTFYLISPYDIIKPLGERRRKRKNTAVIDRWQVL